MRTIVSVPSGPVFSYIQVTVYRRLWIDRDGHIDIRSIIYHIRSKHYNLGYIVKKYLSSFRPKFFLYFPNKVKMHLHNTCYLTNLFEHVVFNHAK